jgi:hypothetical protein
MTEPAISWRPSKPTVSSVAQDAIAYYMDHEARFVLFENGTALLLKPELDQPEIISGAMSELKFKPDFEVMPMKDGNFLVWLASPVCVFISAAEAIELIDELKKNSSAALFPGESFVANPQNPDHYFVGLAGRAKGQLDAKEQKQVARYEPSPT